MTDLGKTKKNSFLLEIYQQWSDCFGLIHLHKKPEPLDSENGPLYTGTFIVLCHHLGVLSFEIATRFLVARGYLEKEKGVYLTTPNSDSDRFSHDNATGLLSALSVLGYKSEIAAFKLFQKQHLHPRDVLYFCLLKWPILFSWAKIPLALMMILSCAQTYKTRNGIKIVKTDGKILSLVRCITLDMKITLKICTYLIEKNPNFGTWYDVFKIYFKEEGHPNRVLSAHL